MIQDTISKIEENIKNTQNINDEKKEAILGLINSLKEEVIELSKTNHEDATTVANFTKVSTHEATKSTKDEELLGLSLKGLSQSVTKFEASHPDLVAVVNSICSSLSNSGF
ncbi:MAG: DUF4404 family protein [Leptospiraceae bacterium]|nr:DUF4404 family protein [Leptospiraceae bacterium]